MGVIRDRVTPAENQRICQQARAAVKAGKLTRPSVCSWCGDDSKPIVGHHPDYDRPLMVVWICRPCHQRHHAEYRIERWLFNQSPRPGRPPKSC